MDDSTANAISGIASSLINTTGNVVSAASNKKIQEMVNEQQWKMAQWQNATNIENWHMQNEYNSPSAQMKRLEEAGLNPNLIYGNGSVNQSASNVAPAQAPNLHAYQYPQNMFAPLGNIVSTLMTSAMIDKTHQETRNLAENQRLTRFDADLRELQKIGQMMANAKSRFEVETMRELYKAKLRSINASTNNTLASTANINSTIDQRELFQNPFLEQQLLSEKERTRNIRQDTLNKIGELSLLEYRKSVMFAQAQDLLSHVDVNSATEQSILKGIEKIDQDIQIGKIKKERDSVELEIRRLLLDEHVDLNEHGMYGFVTKLAHLITSTFYE